MLSKARKENKQFLSIELSQEVTENTANLRGMRDSRLKTEEEKLDKDICIEETEFRKRKLTVCGDAGNMNQCLKPLSNEGQCLYFSQGFVKIVATVT